MTQNPMRLHRRTLDAVRHVLSLTSSICPRIPVLSWSQQPATVLKKIRLPISVSITTAVQASGNPSTFACRIVGPHVGVFANPAEARCRCRSNGIRVRPGTGAAAEQKSDHDQDEDRLRWIVLLSVDHRKVRSLMDRIGSHAKSLTRALGL
jgi:hypothetical protein